MARGVMRLPCETFGLFSILSGYFFALGRFAFGFGAAVDFGMDEAE